VSFSAEMATVAGLELPVRSGNTIVIGSGAAALGAAYHLVRQGQRDLAIVTERWGAGTSRNAGSDKQTYYKLALCDDAEDSPRRMAEDLAAGGCMHGDLALCEAQLSLPAFLNLVALGVPFPHDRYGAFPGYRTDHDPRGRATSAGPLTSRMMCERLGDAIRREGIRVFDQHPVIALLTRDDPQGRSIAGAIALNPEATSSTSPPFVLFNATNVVLATGGPGGLYAASVYPESQTGSPGLGLTIGAAACNLTETQFGIASLKPRWNLSGSYQQAVPRYVSSAGEFLSEVFPDAQRLTTAIFRKGYEWPFDCDKVENHGSSLIDLLVYRETVIRGRRVFLDFTRNPSAPGGGEIDPDQLDDEPRRYLEASRALQARPYQRLEALNPEAAAFFRSHGVDLARDRLEIAVGAQHMNGGLSVDAWWEASVRHLFPVGEVCGSHGVRRPGGAALNAGQVGAMRAAQFIASRYRESPRTIDAFLSECETAIEEAARAARLGEAVLTPAQVMSEVRERMSRVAGPLRRPAEVARATEEAWRCSERTRRDLRAATPRDRADVFRARDLALSHAVVLETLHHYLESGGRSRGSALVLDEDGVLPCEALSDRWRFAIHPEGAMVNRKIQEIRLDRELRPQACWIDVRPLPRSDHWFETTWEKFRQDRIVR